MISRGLPRYLSQCHVQKKNHSHCFPPPEMQQGNQYLLVYNAEVAQSAVLGFVDSVVVNGT